MRIFILFQRWNKNCRTFQREYINDTYANHMLIKIGYDIALRLPFPTAAIYVLRVHSSRKGDLVGSEEFRIEPELSVEEYFDGFGNHCGRVNCPAGVIRFLNHAIIRDPGTLDSYAPDAPQHDVRELPLETLSFVLPSRYCEVDSELLDFVWQTFGATPPGWAQVQAICDFRPWPSPLRLHESSRQSHRARGLSRAGGRLPRFHTSRDYLVPLHEYSRALCDGLSGRYRCPC